MSLAYLVTVKMSFRALCKLQRGEMNMYNEQLGNLENTRTTRANRNLLPLLFTLLIAASFCATSAQAQIIGSLEAQIPFQFEVGNTTLPAGTYVIHRLDDNDETVMQLSKKDGTMSLLFDVESTQANSTPEKTELIFNKYGDRYFLSEMFDEGNPDGSRVYASSDEKMASKQSESTVAQVVANHPQLRGN
jgi:hypothetical protein